MKYFLFIFCFVFTNIATAQLSVHTGFSVGQNLNTFTVEGQNNVLKPGYGEAMTYHVPIRIAIGKWAFNTGVTSTNLTRAYYFETPDGTQYGSKTDDQSSISTLEIPFIISKEFRLIDGISLAPKAGLVWLTNRSRSDSTDVRSGSFNEPDFQVIRSVSSIDNKNKFTARAGVDLNIYPFRHFIVTAGVSYSYGLQQIETTDVTYSVDNEEFSETLISRGNGVNFHVGVKIPFYILHGGHKRALFN